MPGEMDLADKGWLQCLQIRHRAELEIVGGDVNVVHVTEQAASGPAGQLAQELRLWAPRIAEAEIEVRVLAPAAPPQSRLNRVHVAAHHREAFLGRAQPRAKV